MGNHIRALLIAVGLAGTLSACDQETAAPGSPAAEASADGRPFRLPVSLNEVMVALVNHSAVPIWLADWRNPETD